MVSFRRRWDPKTESRLENKNSHAKKKKEKRIRYNRITLKPVVDLKRLAGYAGELHIQST